MIILGKVTGMLYIGNGDIFYPRPYYRIGDILESTNPNNPATDGYIGTWELYGKGRVMVCVDEADTDFNTVGKTTGEKKHTLTIAEMPSHTHTLVYFGNNRPINLNAGGSAYHVNFDQTGSDAEQVGGRSMGEDKPHNNLQPSIVVYRWRRIA